MKRSEWVHSSLSPLGASLLTVSVVLTPSLLGSGARL